MREIPSCLNRRYHTVDELIKELTLATERPSETTTKNYFETSHPSKEPGIKLMCDFWNILEENPGVDLPKVIQKGMALKKRSSVTRWPRQFTCYMADTEKQDDQKDTGQDFNSKAKKPGESSSHPTTPRNNDSMPLSKVLCNLKEAASYDKKCNEKLKDLVTTEKYLQDQIKQLEQRESDGVRLLKQADTMWSSMEEAYQKKVAESLDRQKTLMKELKEVETSAAKWRQNKKELEFQLDNISRAQNEMTEKINQKNTDMKTINMEIEEFKKRIEANKKESEVSKKSLASKKKASDAKIATMTASIVELELRINDEQKKKREKEDEGKKFIADARVDLQKICKVLLQKKLENEDLRAEKEALIVEMNLLKQTCDECKDKCKNKQQTVTDEIKKVEIEIANFKIQCIRCHECTDTNDVRKYCTDCPRCAQQRECILSDDKCSTDQTMDCVCQDVKKKFLDNVFENMYTVLERQSKLGPGKAVAEAVLACLKKSRNGKLNEETRNILQDFILTTVKKNLNLTIVGGAVKTRCEMDPDTYQQLMLCLKQVKATKPPKADKGTVSRKDPCRRWGGPSECNCPKGPKACICTKKAPPRPKDLTQSLPQDKEDADQEVKCPFHKDNVACGPDCSMRAVPSCVGTDVSAWSPDPCKAENCAFSKNMRAAQCVLGPEDLQSPSNVSYKMAVPLKGGVSGLEENIICKCGSTPTKPCACHGVAKQVKAGIAKECDKDTCPRFKDDDDDVIHLKDPKEGRDFFEEVLKNLNNHQRYRPANSDDVTLNTPLKTNSKEQLFNFKVKRGVDDVTDVPVLLKLTPSLNYIFVFDKEFEKSFSKSIDDYFENNPRYPLQFQHTDSDTIIIDFKAISSYTDTKNYGFLTKSPSDNVKILVNDPLLKKVSYDLIKSDSTPKKPASATDKSSEPNNTFLRDSLDKNKTVKSSSASQLYDKGRIKLQDHEPPAKLKKTASGQYAVILNKGSKKAIINDLKNYLASSSQGHIPVKRTESGEITIVLGKDYDEKDRYGSLKISPSGNIYVLVDENVIKEMSEAGGSRRGDTDKRSKHIIKKVVSPEDKAVSTTCNSKPDPSCNEFLCVCDELENKRKYGRHGHGSRPKSVNPDCKKIICDCSTDEADTPCDVTKPSDCRPVLEYDPKYKEQCFCVTEIEYPLVKYKHGTKIVKTTKQRNERENNRDISTIFIHDESLSRRSTSSESTYWDSLNFLPPQLPPFLRDYIK